MEAAESREGVRVYCEHRPALVIAYIVRSARVSPGLANPSVHGRTVGIGTHATRQMNNAGSACNVSR